MVAWLVIGLVEVASVRWAERCNPFGIGSRLVCRMSKLQGRPPVCPTPEQLRMPKGNGDWFNRFNRQCPSPSVRNAVNGERQSGRGNCCVISNLRVACQEHGEWREAMGTWQLLRNLKSESCLSETRWMARGNGDAAIAT